MAADECVVRSAIGSATRTTFSAVAGKPGENAALDTSVARLSHELATFRTRRGFDLDALTVCSIKLGQVSNRCQHGQLLSGGAGSQDDITTHSLVKHSDLFRAASRSEQTARKHS
jgi:hypothetical protein